MICFLNKVDMVSLIDPVFGIPGTLKGSLPARILMYILGGTIGIIIPGRPPKHVEVFRRL